MRATTGGSPRSSASSAAASASSGVARELRPPRTTARTAAARRRRRRNAPARARATSAGARARSAASKRPARACQRRLGPLASMRQRRDLLAGAPVAVELQRRLQRRQRHLVRAQRAHERMRAAPGCDQRAPRRRCMPACGPPSSLSPQKRARDPRRSRTSARTRRLVAEARPDRSRDQLDQRSRAEIDHRRQRRARAPASASSATPTSSVKPTSAKFERCTFEQQRRVGADRPPRSRRSVRAVGGADLDAAAPRTARITSGIAERAADLDQLAARDDHLASGRERRPAPAAPRRRSC